MYKVSLLLFVLLVNVSCCNSEKLLIAGCGWDKIVVLDKKTGLIEWEHLLSPDEDCNDVEQTKEGNILYAYRGGARLIDYGHNVLWDYKVKKGEELYTATQQKDGTYLLAMCGTPSRIIELNSKGDVIKELEFDTGIKNVHGQFRQIQKLKNGNYLIPLMKNGEVVEMTPNGVIFKRVKCGGTPFSLLPLLEGRWLVSCGDGHNLVELDWQEGKVLRVIGDKELLGYKVHFSAEALRYENGNILFCNWNGHTKDKQQPLLIEFDEKGDIVWKLYASSNIKNISSVFSFK